MRGTKRSHLFSSIAVAFLFAAVTAGCGSNEGSANDSTASSIVESDGTTGMVDEPGNPEVSHPQTTSSEDSLVDTTAPGEGTSDDLQDYIDSLAATTDDFDGLTSSADETACAATAILTPVGVEVLQSAGVTVEGVNEELDLPEVTTPESAAGIADGLISCGLGPRFAASFAEGQAVDDLDQTQREELRTCVGAELDATAARSVLVAYLVPDVGDVPSSERAEVDARLAALAADCGVAVTANS